MRVPAGLLGSAAAILLVLTACSKKASVEARLSEVEQAFQAAARGAPAQVVRVELAQPLPAEANAYLNVALSAIRTNNYALGVMALEAVQQTPKVTAAQLMAIQGLKEAVTADLVERAGRGDPTAKAALAAIEKTRSQ